MYVCLCKGLREADVRQVALAGMVTAETVVAAFGLDDEDCCGRCARNVYDLVAIATGKEGCSITRERTGCPTTCPNPV